MRTWILVCACFFGLTLPARPQEPPADSSKAGQPKVKVNMLNVCAPSADDQKEIAGALARIPMQPLFTDDFGVSPGRTQLADKTGLVESGPHARTSPQPASAS